MESEERQARVVAAFGIRALVVTLVVVALWCQVYTQRSAGELLWVAGVVMAGSVGLDYLTRVVTRYRPE